MYKFALSSGNMVRVVEGLLVVLFLVMQAHIWFSSSGLLMNQSLVERMSHQQNALFELERRNDSLQREIQGLKSDPLVLENRARLDLGWVRTGERYYHYTGTA